MSERFGAALAAALVSSAHCCLAPSIWRRLLMQAFCWEVVRALTKLGIAIAANRPMMATTIMISTSVKPKDLREMFAFILLTFLNGVNPAVGDFLRVQLQTFADCNRVTWSSN